MFKGIGKRSMILFSAAMAVSFALTATAADDGFVSIFNGKDLTGWTVQGLEKAVPKIKDGAMDVDGWDYWAVITEKEYGDFILKFDCMFDKKGNSGICVHVPKKEVFKKQSFEIQLNADGGEVAKKCTGSLFTNKGEFKQAEKNPTKAVGEWNSVEIKYQGKKLSLTINGEAVYTDLDMTQFGNLKLNDKGHLAIQRNDYKKGVMFKNIMIKEL